MSTMADESSLSVDEIFSKYSVAEARDIADGYAAKIDQANAELYDLVGSKYRDLIKIAEDINQLYHRGRDIDNALSSLVYRPQQFVSFGDSNLSSFNSRQRAAQASQARADNQGNILRNLINNRLLKVDLLLTGGLKIRHTSQFIHHAKVFYTIGQKFKNILQAEASLDLWFRKLKGSYRRYLEDRIRAYSVLSPHQIASDAVHSSHFFERQHLTGEHSYYDDDTTGSDEDEKDRSSIKETAVLYPNIDVVTSHSAAIVNYLVAYTILIAPDEKVDIGTALVDLRRNYWHEVVDDFSDADNLSFVHTMKYIEATMEYADMIQDKSSDYHKVLALTTRPWKSRNFIGYKNWLENEDVTYSGDNVSFSGASSQLEQLTTEMFDWVAKLIDRQTPHSALAIAQNANIFARFALDYLGIKDFYANFDTKLLLSAHIDQSTQFCDLLGTVIEAILHHFEQYFDLGHQAALKAVTAKSLSSHIPSAFSSDTIRLMDTDIDEYLRVVATITSGGASPVAEAVGKWITEYDAFCTVMRFEDDDSVISKLTASTKTGDIKGFTSDFVVQKLETVQDKSHHLFNKYLADIVDRIDNDMSSLDKQNTDEVYFYLDALKVIKEKSGGINGINDTVSRVDTLLSRLYDAIIETIDETFVVSYVNIVNDDVPMTPSMELSSVLGQITQTLLSGGSGERKFGKLFLDESVQDLFKLKKNQWVARAQQRLQQSEAFKNGGTKDATDNTTANGSDDTKSSKDAEPSVDEALAAKVTGGKIKVDGVVSDGAETNNNKDEATEEAKDDATEESKPSDDKASNDAKASSDAKADQVEEKSSSSSSSQWVNQQKFADLVYLSLLMGESGNDVTGDLDDTTRNVIISGVTHYHNSSKCLLLPLST